MSDVGANLGTATGYLDIDASGVERGVASAENSLQSLDQILYGNLQGIRNLGYGFEAFTSVVGAALGGAIKSAVDWESAMAGVERTNYDSSQSAAQNKAAIDSLGDSLQNLSTIKPLAASDLAKIAETAGSLGLARKDVAAFTSVVADLAATTDLTADQATTSMARIAGIMGVPAAQFRNLASAIVQTGISTQATEPEIVSMATRLSGVANTVGLTADQLIGLSAAVSSVGIRAEMGSTAIQKTFTDMAAAVSEGGQKLALFARVAGVSSEQFSQLFKDNAAQALLQYVNGLGRMQQAGQDVTGVLDALGEKEARQANTLQRLGAAQVQTINSNIRLSSAYQVANQAFQQGTALQEIAARRYETTAAQLRILQNEVLVTARTYGALFLPALGLVVSGLQDFFRGLNAIPAPMRAIIAVLGAITFSLGTLAATFLLIAPRIIQTRAALAALSGAQIQAAGTARAHAVALDGVAGAALAANESLLGLRAGTAASGVASAGAAAGIASVATRANAANGVIGFLASNFGRFTKVLGILGVALSVASVAVGIFGSRQRAAADPANNLASVNQALVQAILQSQGANQDAANSFLINALSMANVIPVAQRLGFTMAQLIAIIKGAADASLMSQFQESVNGAIKGGDNEAKKLQAAVSDLQGQWQSANEVAKQQVAAQQEMGISTGDLTQDTKELAKAAREAQEALDQQNQAIISLVDAEQQQESAQLSLKEAQVRYQEALVDARNPLEEVQKAELDLQQARLSAEDAARTLADSEAKLRNVRADALDDLLDAQDSLQDAYDKYADSLDNITEKQEELNDLQRGPTVRELTDAVNDLADAQLRLTDAEVAVSDAQYQLNYLMGEGASTKDIEAAQRALAKAQQSVADSQQGIAESQDKLNDLQDGAGAEELAKAQREYNASLRDSSSALRDISDKQAELNQAQIDYASNRAYLDALEEVRSNQLSLQQANLRVQESQNSLAKAQIDSGSASLAVEQANLAVEDALIAVARANTEVVKQTALARGEFFDAGREAQEFGRQLASLAGQAPTDEDRKRIESYAAALSKAKPGKKISDEAPSPGGGGGIGGGLSGLGDLSGMTDALGDFNSEAEKSPSLLDKIKDKVPEILSAIVGGIAGYFAGGALAGAIAGPLGIVIGIIGGALVGLIVTKVLTPIFQGLINNFPKWISAIAGFFASIPSALANIVPLVLGFVVNLVTSVVLGMAGLTPQVVGVLAQIPGLFIALFSTIGGIILGFFTETLPAWAGNLGQLAIQAVVALAGLAGTFGEWFLRILNSVIQFAASIPGGLVSLLSSVPDLARRVWNGFLSITSSILGALFNFIAGVPGRILGLISSLIGFLADIGSRAASGLYNGLANGVVSVYNFVAGIPGRIFNALNSMYDTALGVGKNVAIGLYNGIISPGFNLYNKLVDWVTSNIPGPIKKALGISSPSKIAMQLGQFTSEGLLIGLVSMRSQIQDAATSLAESIASNIDPRTIGAFDVSSFAGGINPNIVQSIAGVAASTPAGSTERGGDIINNINTVVQDAAEIADEISWSQLVRRRS